MGCSKSSSKRGIYSDAILPQETRKVSNSGTLYLKQLDKGEKQNPKLVEGKKSCRSEQKYEIETNKRSMKLKAGSLKRGTPLVVQGLSLCASNAGGLI